MVSAFVAPFVAEARRNERANLCKNGGDSPLGSMLVALTNELIYDVPFFFVRSASPVCNRTYYARLGTTYRLSLVRPRLTGTTQILPWHCWFNFTALGGHHGDRVLVSPALSLSFRLIRRAELCS